MTPQQQDDRQTLDRSRLATMLDDPLIRLVMERDRTDRREILDIVAMVRAARKDLFPSNRERL